VLRAKARAVLLAQEGVEALVRRLRLGQNSLQEE
jgi:hypothetical protein